MHAQSTQGSTFYPSAPNSAVIQASDDSVSPEPLSEAAMRPPPVPQPMMTSQNGNNPVTPATLMRMPSSQTVSAKQLERQGSVQVFEEPMEDIMLPDAAAVGAPAILASLDRHKPGDEGEDTPTLSAKTIKLSAGSTPRSMLARTDSPETFAKPGKFDSRGGGRASKKRQTTTSATISPALRPKISPSISPLAPATGE